MGLSVLTSAFILVFVLIWLWQLPKASAYYASTEINRGNVMNQYMRLQVDVVLHLEDSIKQQQRQLYTDHHEFEKLTKTALQYQWTLVLEEVQHFGTGPMYYDRTTTASQEGSDSMYIFKREQILDLHWLYNTSDIDRGGHWQGSTIKWFLLPLLPASTNGDISPSHYSFHETRLLSIVLWEDYLPSGQSILLARQLISVPRFLVRSAMAVRGDYQMPMTNSINGPHTSYKSTEQVRLDASTTVRAYPLKQNESKLVWSQLSRWGWDLCRWIVWLMGCFGLVLFVLGGRSVVNESQILQPATTTAQLGINNKEATAASNSAYEQPENWYSTDICPEQELEAPEAFCRRRTRQSGIPASRHNVLTEKVDCEDIHQKGNNHNSFQPVLEVLKGESRLEASMHSEQQREPNLMDLLRQPTGNESSTTDSLAFTAVPYMSGNSLACSPISRSMVTANGGLQSRSVRKHGKRTLDHEHQQGNETLSPMTSDALHCEKGLSNTRFHRVDSTAWGLKNQVAKGLEIPRSSNATHHRDHRRVADGFPHSLNTRFRRHGSRTDLNNGRMIPQSDVSDHQKTVAAFQELMNERYQCSGNDDFSGENGQNARHCSNEAEILSRRLTRDAAGDSNGGGILARSNLIEIAPLRGPSDSTASQMRCTHPNKTPNPPAWSGLLDKISFDDRKIGVESMTVDALSTEECVKDQHGAPRIINFNSQYHPCLSPYHPGLTTWQTDKTICQANIENGPLLSHPSAAAADRKHPATDRHHETTQYNPDRQLLIDDSSIRPPKPRADLGRINVAQGPANDSGQISSANSCDQVESSKFEDDHTVKGLCSKTSFLPDHKQPSESEHVYEVGHSVNDLLLTGIKQLVLHPGEDERRDSPPLQKAGSPSRSGAIASNTSAFPKNCHSLENCNGYGSWLNFLALSCEEQPACALAHNGAVPIESSGPVCIATNPSCSLEDNCVMDSNCNQPIENKVGTFEARLFEGVQSSLIKSEETSMDGDATRKQETRANFNDGGCGSRKVSSNDDDRTPENDNESGNEIRSSIDECNSTNLEQDRIVLLQGGLDKVKFGLIISHPTVSVDCCLETEQDNYSSSANAFPSKIEVQSTYVHDVFIPDQTGTAYPAWVSESLCLGHSIVDGALQRVVEEQASSADANRNKQACPIQISSTCGVEEPFDSLRQQPEKHFASPSSLDDGAKAAKIVGDELPEYQASDSLLKAAKEVNRETWVFTSSHNPIYAPRRCFSKTPSTESTSSSKKESALQASAYEDDTKSATMALNRGTKDVQKTMKRGFKRMAVLAFQPSKFRGEESRTQRTLSSRSAMIAKRRRYDPETSTKKR